MSFNEMVKKQRAKSVSKSAIDWDDLVEKGQTISQLLEEIKSAVINNHGGSSNEDSIINIINEIEDEDLIYNLNWNLVSARTYHRHDE